MTRHRYSPPTPKERKLKEELDAARAQISQLLNDCTGAVTITDLEGRILTLEKESQAKDGRIISLQNRNDRLTEKYEHAHKLALSRKKETASLKLDLLIAHSYGRDLEHKLAVCEHARYSWAERARVAEKVNSGLRKTNSDLRAKTRHLEAKLSRNPANSSVPPSMSPIKKVHNSRVKSNRQSGGQPGHIGHGRKVYVPDEIVLCDPPCACTECGGALIAAGEQKTRCLTDLVITVKTTGYAATDHVCVECGHRNPALFPTGVLNEQNYGNNLRAITTFLVNRCNVSEDNVIDFLYEATDHKLKVSSGSIHNFRALFSSRAKDAIADIEAELKVSPVIGSDATHTSSAGKRTYVYTYNNDNCTLYQASKSKGLAPLGESLLPDFTGIIIHDHDVSYYNFGAGHAECNVHILRYLKGVCENEPNKLWAPAMIKLLNMANGVCKEACADNLCAISPDRIAAIESRYDMIVALAEREYEADQPINPKYKPDGIALFTRLKEYRNEHLAFIHDLRIPFSNNASEQRLRRVKMKTKQSGGFRSLENGQAYYCDFLSVTETASMRDMEVLGVVRDVFEGKKNIFESKARSPVPADP